MNAFVIDAFEFCRLKEMREGEVAVADLPRLAQEVVGKSGEIRWSLQGGSNIHGHPQMELVVAGVVELVCQRCLVPVVFSIESASVLVLARDEEGADEIEALLESESVEVIVGSNALNILDLVEDDALLSLPLSPRHEACPNQLSLPVAEGAGSESPFAVLKNLKQ